MKKIKDLNKRVDVNDGTGNLVNVKAYELEESLTSINKVETNKVILQQKISQLIAMRDDLDQEILDYQTLLAQMED